MAALRCRALSLQVVLSYFASIKLLVLSGSRGAPTHLPQNFEPDEYVPQRVAKKRTRQQLNQRISEVGTQTLVNSYKSLIILH